MYITSKFSSSLLQWYDINRRDLPWRECKGFYPVYLSEVMLQQTKVETVIPYYKKWLNKYPTLETVALSNIDDLLKLWEGLGYYSRCVNFFKACSILYYQHNSQLPDDRADFLKLPGVGYYISSAVYSIVKKFPTPAIDTNVNRVISRVLAIKNLTPHNKKRIFNMLEKCIDRERPGDVNQALMDLGSSICGSTKTQCNKCPISTFCKAKETLLPVQYPLKKKKSIKNTKYFIAAIIWNKNKFLIKKRSFNSMLGGLWELPNTEIDLLIPSDVHLLKYIKKTLYFTITVQNKICTIKHSYSHFNISISLYHCTTDEVNNRKINNISWIQPDDINNYTFSKSNHKLFKKLNNNGWNN